jgi:hypothetical protein
VSSHSRLTSSIRVSALEGLMPPPSLCWFNLGLNTASRYLLWRRYWWEGKSHLKSNEFKIEIYKLLELNSVGNWISYIEWCLKIILAKHWTFCQHKTCSAFYLVANEYGLEVWKLC